MNNLNAELNAADEYILRELAGFLPHRIFDAHLHLPRMVDMDSGQHQLQVHFSDDLTVNDWREHLSRQIGDSELQGGLLIPLPSIPERMDGANEYIISQLHNEAESRGLLLVAPDYPPERILELLENPGIIGFKPYHLLGTESPSFQASLPNYMPEWAWKIADERELVITLHMVRDRALADPDNQYHIQRMCSKYPRTKLVLAHAARGFHAPNTVHGLAALTGLENVWFDSSQVCEAASLLAILRAFGPRKLLWGSDFPVNLVSGRCVTIGDGFLWIMNNTLEWEKVAPACRPALSGLEALRALKEAADTFGLAADDLDDIFFSNARRLFGIEQAPATLTQDTYRHAKMRMPAGTQLLSKRPEMMAPDQWPAYFREARGCEIWDLEGRHYFDLSNNAVGACLLGYRDADVTRAVTRRLNLGSLSTLNAPEEVELADNLCAMHPWAEQVRFARTGGEVAAVAVRIARATTDRSLVAVCGYHGWHDWYLAANLGDNDALRGHLLPGLDPLGVPRELRGTALPFRYNQRVEFQAIVDQHGDRLAAVIMEPCRYLDPEPGFLEFVRDAAHQAGALLIFDEITIGFRLRYGGAHPRFGVNPDMAIFGKTLGNGHAMAAVIGTREAMAGAHASFISSSYWTESLGPVAALTTLAKMQRIDVPAHLERIGTLVTEVWRQAASTHNLPVIVEDGYLCLPRFRFDHEQATELRTFFTQLMLRRGFLATCAIMVSLAHTEEIVARYGEAVDGAFAEIALALANGDVQKKLNGPVAHTGFSRLLP